MKVVNKFCGGAVEILHEAAKWLLLGGVIGLVGGAGGSMLQDAIEAGADCLLTGEANHHVAIDARRLGISLVVAGHYATEFPIVPVVADKLKQRFAGVRVLCSRRNKDPFSYL